MYLQILVYSAVLFDGVLVLCSRSMASLPRTDHLLVFGSFYGSLYSGTPVYVCYLYAYYVLFIQLSDSVLQIWGGGVSSN
jgi:hypothetical protein